MPRVTSHPANQPIWFDLMTSDAAAARRFYAATLGWVFDEPDAAMGNYAIARVGDAPAAGVGEIPPGAPFPVAWSVYFGVTDADATARAITAAGGSVVAPPMDVGAYGRMAFCQDPTGPVFGLWQPGMHTGAGILNEPGGMAWCEANSRDADAAARFYATVFGLVDDPMDMGGTRYHMLKQGSAPVCGVLQMTADWGEIPPHWMAYFAVPDIQAAKAAVLAHGGQVPHGPFGTAYGEIMVVIDPQGAAISYIQLAEMAA